MQGLAWKLLSGDIFRKISIPRQMGEAVKPNAVLNEASYLATTLHSNTCREESHWFCDEQVSTVLVREGVAQFCLPYGRRGGRQWYFCGF